MQDIHQITDELVRKSGSSSLKGKYRGTLLGRQASEGKLELRRKIKSLFLNLEEKEEFLSVMTLPGPQWEFEHDLSRNCRGKINFHCFENNLSLMHRGLVNVPCYNSEYSKNRWRKFEALGVDYFKTNRSRWIRCEFETWATVRHCDMKTEGKRMTPKQTYEWWRKRFWTVNAIWLDFTACLHPRLEAAICRIPELLKADKFQEIAIAITVQKGRECRQTTSIINAFGSRFSYLAFLLDRRDDFDLKIIEESEYVSNQGVAMVTLIAKYIRKF